MSQADETQTFEVHLPEESLAKYPRAGRRFIEVRGPESPVVVVRLPAPPPPTKFERERRAFYRLLPDLLQTHRGQYVAVHDEQVVDSGPVRAEVVCRTLDRVRADIFVGLVTDEPPPVVRSGIRRVVSDRGPRP